METKKTMFMIEFINGKKLKFDEDRFMVDFSAEFGKYFVIRNYDRKVVVECNADKVLYVRHAILKRDRVKPEDNAEEDVSTIWRIEEEVTSVDEE